MSRRVVGVRPSARRSEAGSATIYVLVLAALLIAAGYLAGGYGAALALRHRAEAAADLAALAAAREAGQGERAACATAARVADVNRAVLRGCGLRGLVAETEVTAHGRGVLSRFGAATARARAGPASPGQMLIDDHLCAGRCPSGPRRTGR